MKNNTQKIVLILLSLLTSTVMAQNTIKVTGKALVSIINSKAQISASIISEDVSADVAVTGNSEKMQSVIDALAGIGINNNDVQTGDFSFTPVYDWDNGQQNFIGYRVRNSISIRISDSSTVGPVIDLIIDAGVSRVNGVNFNPNDFSSAQQQALIAATTDAKSKAETLAQASSLELGDPISIEHVTKHSNPFSSETLANTAPPSSGGDTVILPGSDNISATVAIEYRIINNNGIN